MTKKKIIFIVFGVLIIIAGILLYQKYSRKIVMYRSMFKEKVITTPSGIELYTENFGEESNPAILLIAGAMASARFWIDEFCQQLANAGYFVIRYDHRDMGFSCSIDYAKYPYMLNDLAKDAKEILDVYKIDKAHMIGHSMGGLIAKIVALDYPDSCLSVTCISSSQFVSIFEQKDLLTDQEKASFAKTWEIMMANNPAETYEKSVDGFLKVFKYLNGTIQFDEQMAKDVLKDLYQRSNHVQWFEKFTQTKEMHNHVKAQQNMKDRTQELKNIKTPVFIIHGELDPMCFSRLAIGEAEKMPMAKICIIPGMGHMIFNRRLFAKIGDIILKCVSERNMTMKDCLTKKD